MEISRWFYLFKIIIGWMNVCQIFSCEYWPVDKLRPHRRCDLVSDSSFFVSLSAASVFGKSSAAEYRDLMEGPSRVCMKWCPHLFAVEVLVFQGLYRSAASLLVCLKLVISSSLVMVMFGACWTAINMRSWKISTKDTVLILKQTYKRYRAQFWRSC